MTFCAFSLLSQKPGASINVSSSLTLASFEAKSKIPPHVNQTVINITQTLFCFVIHVVSRFDV